MTIKNKFKSLKNKIKKVFTRKDEDTAFYLPDEAPDNFPEEMPKEEPFERTGVKKDFSPSGESGKKILNFLPSFFSVEKRPLVHKIFLTLLFFSFCFFAARISALFLTPKNLKTMSKKASSSQSSSLSKQDWNKKTASLNSNDLFKTAKIKENKPVKEKEVNKDERCFESDKISKLPLNLMSTSVLQDSIKSLAAVQVRGSSDLEHVREGDEIESLAKIFRIERLKLIFRNLKNGECEYVVNGAYEEEKKRKMPEVISQTEFKGREKNYEKEEGIKQSGNKVCISRKVLDSKLKNVTKIMQDAKALPITNPNGTLSFKIVEIQPGSIYSHLNIQDQDIIKSINGKPIKNYNDVMGLFGKIKSVSKLSLDVERGGSIVPMKYEITKKDPVNCL